MRKRLLTLGPLGALFAFLLTVATGTSAHALATADGVVFTSPNHCLKAFAGVDSSAAASAVFSYQADCTTLRADDARTRLVLQKQNGIGQWVQCVSTDWVYGTSWAGTPRSTYAFTWAPCGTGTYRTVGYAQIWILDINNVGWFGGSVTTPPQFLA